MWDDNFFQPGTIWVILINPNDSSKQIPGETKKNAFQPRLPPTLETYLKQITKTSELW